MALIRSGKSAPVEIRFDLASLDGREYADWVESSESEDSAYEYEASLPDQPDEWGDVEQPWDAYDELAYKLGTDDVDDRPLWERESVTPCAQCGLEAQIDPFGTCFDCRANDGRCSWCGLDPLVYPTEGACRTCYRRLRRANVTSVTCSLALAVEMRAAGFRRADLRKRHANNLAAEHPPPTDFD